MIQNQESKICLQIRLSNLKEMYQNFGIKFITTISNFGGKI